MTTRYFGESIKRNEDPRLLTGQALFTDDVNLPDMLHVAFLRSPFAHARINSIDIAEAQNLPGIVAVYRAEDLGDYWQPGPLLVPPPPIENLDFNSRSQVPLARTKVCHAGEAIVAVVAESRYLAEDALAYIQVDYEPLDAVVGLEEAVAEGTPVVHEDLGHNINAHAIQQCGTRPRHPLPFATVSRPC